MSTVKRALRYMIDKNSNLIPEYMNSMPEKGKDLEVHPKGGIGSTLIPCKCPQDFGQVAVIDATTKGRIVKFSIKVNNLCRNKEYNYISGFGFGIVNGLKLLSQKILKLQNIQDVNLMEQTLFIFN